MDMSGSMPVGRRIRFLRWLREVHGWIGLWGATLGLLFGTTGILLNHRSVMKIPAADSRESSLQLQLPQPVPASAQELADWVRVQLALDAPVSRLKEEPPKPVAWSDKALRQPARWSASLTTPQVAVQMEYWVGNSYVAIKQSDNNLFATLNNLHKGVGMDAGWVLLADTLAGSIILLSLSGVLMWTQLNARRTAGTLILFGSLSLTLLLALRGL